MTKRPSKSDFIRYMKSHTRADAANAFNVSEGTIRRWEKEYSCANTKDGWGACKLKGKADEIRDLYRQGQHNKFQIAKMYGVTPTTIGNIVNNISYREPTPKRSMCIGGSAAVDVSRTGFPTQSIAWVPKDD